MIDIFGPILDFIQEAWSLPRVIGGVAVFIGGMLFREYLRHDAERGLIALKDHIRIAMDSRNIADLTIPFRKLNTWAGEARLDDTQSPTIKAYLDSGIIQHATSPNNFVVADKFFEYSVRSSTWSKLKAAFRCWWYRKRLEVALGNNTNRLTIETMSRLLDIKPYALSEMFDCLRHHNRGQLTNNRENLLESQCQINLPWGASRYPSYIFAENSPLIKRT